ncbi:MAG: sulfite exporter TauE/SafE family protein [Candidatus Yanofskybacteria bacterium]|nr:sulfite exporter TauE/SafE family protein [Candidatus Yanofskybacteria bacterium]
MEKETFLIQGMHCRSCELMIEEHISKIPSVQKVQVDHKRGIAFVQHSGKLPYAEVEKAVRDSGYTLGSIQQKKPFLSHNPLDYIELSFAVGALLLLAIWLKVFGIFDLNYSFGSSPGLIIVALVGLTAGISTCMALVGGIVLAISTRHAELHPEATPSQKFKPHLFFNAGRILSYTILGGVVGLVGSAFRLSNTVLGILIIVVGIVMFMLGLKLIEIFPRMSGGFALPKSIGRLFGIKREAKEYSHQGAFLSGMATFFLPCGFTQAMQLYAMSTGSFVQGGLIMGVFALGTMPGLLGVGGLTSFIKGWFSRYFFKFAGLVVIVLALFNISNGYNLTGATAGFAAQEKQGSGLDSKIENGIQTVEMTQTNGYKPNNLTIKKGVPVKWVITSTNPYNCSSYIMMPSLGITKALQQGKNVIEFTPQKTGTIKFTCSMGMYRGSFNVIN